MSTFIVVSHFALWGVVLLQSLVILVLLRQVGLLHLRIRPAGARVLPVGPPIGERAPTVLVRDMEEESKKLQIHAEMGADLFLLFISPQCAVCGSLMPSIRALEEETRRGVRWAIIAAGGRERARRFRSEHALKSMLFAYGPELHKEFKVGLTPYAVVIGKNGVVVAKGLVNQMEHLESLLESQSLPEAPEPKKPVVDLTPVSTK